MYDRRVGQHTLSFGVSGRLYHSNLLLYDRQTESLWSQIRAEAVAGRFTGSQLMSVPFTIKSWREWKEQFPHGRVLAQRKAPALLSGIGKALSALIPVPSQPHAADPGMQESLAEFVLGVTAGDKKKAYPLDVLAATDKATLVDTISDEKVTIFFLPESAFAYAQNGQGRRLPAVVTYRATWLAFYPDSQVYLASE